MPHLVRRADIPVLTSVVVDGEVHNLGLLKDFRKHPKLAELLPSTIGVSMSWVHLQPGEQLDVHEHPVQSVILIARGTGRSLGDLEEELIEGDVFIVPPGHRHGFVGSGKEGFWALSLQFEPTALYEDPANAQVRFGPHKSSERPPTANTTRLMAVNQTYVNRWAEHRIFGLLKDGVISRDPIKRRRLLDCLQVWSNQFQRIVLSRAAYTDNRLFRSLAAAHLDEEFNHHKLLAGDRLDAGNVWDPVLESTSEWFVSKMLSMDNPEKIVLVHLVLEGAAAVFYAVWSPIMREGERHSSAHWNAHAGEIVLDDQHVQMGLDLLNALPLRDFSRLESTLKIGWEMMYTMFDRIVHLIEAPLPPRASILPPPVGK